MNTKWILVLALVLSNWAWLVSYHQLRAEDQRLLEWNHTVETKMDCKYR